VKPLRQVFGDCFVKIKISIFVLAVAVLAVLLVPPWSVEKYEREYMLSTNRYPGGYENVKVTYIEWRGLSSPPSGGTINFSVLFIELLAVGVVAAAVWFLFRARKS
jgi:ABC-type uncharacterized transport system permease subunit